MKDRFDKALMDPLDELIALRTLKAQSEIIGTVEITNSIEAFIMSDSDCTRAVEAGDLVKAKDARSRMGEKVDKVLAMIRIAHRAD